MLPTEPLLSATRLIVKRLKPEAKLPTRATNGSAGYDLYSIAEIVLLPGESILADTGLQVILPEGTCGMIMSRSGLAVKYGLEKGAGLIDCDYRGPIGVVLRNLGTKVFTAEAGSRIAQMVIVPILTPAVVEYDGPSEDGTHAGFGSTGLK